MPGVGGLVGSGGSSFIGTLHTTIYIIFTLAISIYTICIPPFFYTTIYMYALYIGIAYIGLLYYICTVLFSFLVTWVRPGDPQEKS
jgi:hypothetical protein